MTDRTSSAVSGSHRSSLDLHNEPQLVHRVRLVTWCLWTIVLVVEALLILRIVVMLISGVTGPTMGGTSQLSNILYAITGFAAILDTGIGFAVPFHGSLAHAFDIAALLLMDALFFMTLVVTKLMLWYAQKAVARRKIMPAGQRR